MDFLIASGGLLFFALPMIFLTWRIRRKSNASPFFHQIRIGCQGCTFTIVKFRTMSEGGDVLSSFSQRLRDTAMDELPQLFHIWRGQMSFVGPRPLIPEELEELRQMAQGIRRFDIRPGLTGLAQLYATKVPPLAERLMWDLRYVDHCSFFLDIKILVKSLWITLRGAWEPRYKSKAPLENPPWPF